MPAIVTLSGVDFTSALPTGDSSLVLEHGEHLGLRLVVSHARHSHKLDASLIASILPTALLEVVPLALIHYEDDSVVHGRELLVGEAGGIHLKFCLTDVSFVLGHVISCPRVPRRDILIFAPVAPAMSTIFVAAGPAAARSTEK